ncbi:putative phytosulfokines 6 [Carica papaya]|uniref:putative phytosulfokines 6 n=1 Tax=Carica papaya TaxID=3649 RepID=UPI000B8C8595|nr:putative phytosulfokines 6 [Carica papaya]
MNLNIHLFLLFLLSAFLLLSFPASASRLLPHTQGEKELKTNRSYGTIGRNFTRGTLNLMGAEECDERDEECVKRRMIADAHLDYIYTQHRKP